MFLSRAIPSTILSNSGFGISFPLLAIQLVFTCTYSLFSKTPFTGSILSPSSPSSLLPTAYRPLPAQRKSRLTFARDGPLLRRNLSKCSNPHPKLLSGEGQRALAPVPCCCLC